MRLVTMPNTPNVSVINEMLLTGLYILLHPAIPDGRTWSKLGEHGKYGEHTVNIEKMETVYLRLKTLTLFVNQ